MGDPSVESRLTKLNAALKTAKELNKAPESQWKNESESAFGIFRTCVMHLRKEPAALDSVGEKEQVWQFIVKFCKSFSFHHDRCNEVLRILMNSESWMEKFSVDDEILEDLPEGIAGQLQKCQQIADEVRRKPRGEEEPGEKKPSEPPPPQKGAKAVGRGSKPTPWSEPTPAQAPVSTPMRPSNMAVVVQRCTKARVLIDERNQWWGDIGHGIMISVSFTRGAKPDAVSYAARFLLDAKLSTRDTWEPGQPRGKGRPAVGTDAESVINICREGKDQAVLVMPQASIAAGLEKDNVSLEYGAQCEAKKAEALYLAFIEALDKAAKEMIGTSPGVKPLRIVSSPFHGQQYVESTSAQPFLHAFNF